MSLHAIVKCNLFPFFLLFVVGGGGISGRVRALNLTVPLGSGRVGSDDLVYGPGSGFSFEPVQISSVNTKNTLKNGCFSLEWKYGYSICRHHNLFPLFQIMSQN